MSIVLPTRNGAATLPPLLDALWRQRAAFPTEIIAVDSESTDGTVELLTPRVDRLIAIPAAQFDHGLTRNLGIEQASGELVVLLVQDALPVSPRWLETLTSPLVADESLAGTFARQEPRPGASAVTRHYLSRWAACGDVGWTVSLAGRAEFDALTPMGRLMRCAFDNVCSCIRRSVWMTHPFPPSPIAEDLAWARDVLLAGYRLQYVPDAVVVHSHDRSAWYELVRTRLVHQRLFELFGLHAIPSLGVLAHAVTVSAAVHLRCEWTRPAQLPRALALALAFPLGQYLGGRAAARGAAAIRSRVV